MSSLSAAGSKMAPTRERWLRRRAIMPSRTSVIAAVTNTTNATRYSPRIDATMNTGTSSRRSNVRRFGIVSTKGLKFEAELLERGPPQIDRLSFREQQVLAHEVVDETRHRLARRADHIRDRLMRRP